jgi:Flp pilus assembly protein TadG
MRTLLRRIRADRRGGLIVEFAFAMPVLTLMLMGGVEISRYALMNQRMDRLATVVGDLVSQQQTVSQADLNAIFGATKSVAWPFDLAASGKVIISSISIPTPPTPVKITWQSASGTLAVSSKFGAQNATPALPNGLTVAPGQTIIAAEVYYHFTPILIGALVPEQNVYYKAFFRPRTGSLTTLSP